MVFWLPHSYYSVNNKKKKILLSIAFGDDCLLPIETFEGHVFDVVFFTCFDCNSNLWFPQDESEFRDKLTPITIFMEYRLDYRTAADATGLHPILNQFTPANMSRQVHFLRNL